jgi:hypothetical protein
MAVMAIGALGALAGGIGGMMQGNKAAKAQAKHNKWVKQRLIDTESKNAALYGQALGEQRQGLLALKKSQKERRRLFGDLGSGAAETINRSAQGQLADVNQMADRSGINSRFLGARTGVMRNQSLALNELKSQLAGLGIQMQGGFGAETAGAHSAIAGTMQNQAGLNASMFGSGAAYVGDSAPQGYSPQGDFLAALGQGVSFFAGLQSLNKQQQQVDGL